jgi:hypothetical protein
VAVDVVELEHLRGDHGAQRVTLAALRIDADLHGDCSFSALFQAW